MSTFYERLKELRKESKLTQKQLADKLFIDDTSISKYENKKALPENELLQKIADQFNVSTDYLLGRSDIRSYPNEGLNKSTQPSKKDIKDHDEFMAEARAMFMNGEVADEDKEKIFKDISDLFWESKKINKEKYGKKNKK